MEFESIRYGSILQVRDIVRKAIEKALHRAGLGDSVDEIHLERPKDLVRGDLSSNVAMAISSKVSKNPEKLAEEIVTNIELDSDVIEKVEVAGPGFINFRFSVSYLTGQIVQINRLRGKFGDSERGSGKKV
jgi:arginyl-tRNA synthetase